ncbi:MAG TPA: histone deacetylase [Nitrospirae bacterium]|nr:histone deacetylase-like amidohydrolase [bacterium BMS3Abin06]HDH12288.1 histone deacetylase [Nitrospirota bacterium]HDZ00795.1 histone deacetylase [Nitrospirota bacterium]
MKIFYSPECLEYSRPGHPESPARVESTYNFLKEKGYDFAGPAPCADEDILLAHTPKLLDSLKKESFFDFDTPAFPGIFEIAKLSAGAAVDAAMHCLSENEKAFSLMRPPGHHATKNDPGGFCYFNNIAIASIKAGEKVGKIAIVDFDCHHGNGTEDIMLGKKNFLYLSLHQSPLYPGTGLRSRENCINYPLSSSTSPEQYLAALAEGLKEVERFNPDLLAISAGFDSYKLDPITSLTLEQETYREIGKMLSGLNRPAFAVLEGGYSRDLPDCVYQFLSGLEE